MSSVATFNMCLESARDNRTVTKTKDLETVNQLEHKKIDIAT